jgi:hypothetical protein
MFGARDAARANLRQFSNSRVQNIGNWRTYTHHTANLVRAAFQSLRIQMMQMTPIPRYVSAILIMILLTKRRSTTAMTITTLVYRRTLIWVLVGCASTVIDARLTFYACRPRTTYYQENFLHVQYP